MEEDKKLDELAKTFASQINQQDVNVISNLANNALKNNDEKMENVSNAFNEAESKKDEDELTPEEIQFYKSILVEPVESSNIEGISYLSESKTLKIRFKGGGEYIYKGVEELQYKNIQNAKSIGKYFNDNIKAFPDKYKFIKL